MKVFINGKRTKSGRPFYSLMEMSAASGLPIYDGGDADVVFNWGGSGKPTPSILKYAEDKTFDLIAMSTHGISGITRWVYGSVASRIIELSSKNILLVRNEPS